MIYQHSNWERSTRRQKKTKSSIEMYCMCNVTEPYVKKKETATENSVSKFRDEFYFWKIYILWKEFWNGLRV